MTLLQSHFIKRLGAQRRAMAMKCDILSPHPRSTATSQVAAQQGSADGIARKLLPLETFVRIVMHPVPLQHTIVKIKTQFAPNSNTTKHYHLFQTGVNTAWPQRFQSLGLKPGHCPIEDRLWRRALSRQAGREDRFLFLQTLSWGKTSRWWHFNVWVYLPFKSKTTLNCCVSANQAFAKTRRSGWCWGKLSSEWGSLCISTINFFFSNFTNSNAKVLPPSSCFSQYPCLLSYLCLPHLQYHKYSHPSFTHIAVFNLPH